MKELEPTVLSFVALRSLEGRRGVVVKFFRTSPRTQTTERSWERERRRKVEKDREKERERGEVCTQEAAFILVLHRQWSANWRTVITVAITADTFHVYVVWPHCVVPLLASNFRARRLANLLDKQIKVTEQGGWTACITQLRISGDVGRGGIWNCNGNGIIRFLTRLSTIPIRAFDLKRVNRWTSSKGYLKDWWMDGEKFRINHRTIWIPISDFQSNFVLLGVLISDEVKSSAC